MYLSLIATVAMQTSASNPRRSPILRIVLDCGLFFGLIVALGVVYATDCSSSTVSEESILEAPSTAPERKIPPPADALAGKSAPTEKDKSVGLSSAGGRGEGKVQLAHGAAVDKPAQIQVASGLAPTVTASRAESKKPPTLVAAVEKPAPTTGLNNIPRSNSVKGDDGKEQKKVTEFFGIGGSGETFVYVVDCSGSMSEQDKFNRACKELVKSIRQLTSKQRYFIIFYNDRTFPMKSPKPVTATPTQLAKTVRWLKTGYATGGTYPLPALTQALSMKPDAIYFLSDGLFDSSTVLELRAQNTAENSPHQRPTPIHTIAFVDHEAEVLMQTIAKDSGGEYRFVK